MDYPFYLAIYYYLTQGSYPINSTDSVKRRIRNQAKKYHAHQGRLYRKVSDDELGPELVHEGNVNDIIAKVHNEGHFGINNTWKRLCLNYTGPKLFERVREYVQGCQTCLFRSRPPRKRYEPAHPIPTPSQPFYMVGLDAVGPIRYSGKPDRYILVAVDYLTRWPMARVVDQVDESTTADFIYDDIIVEHGVPQYLLTDRGSAFTSFFIEAFLKRIGCRHITTTAYRPQTNGLCERLNQTLVQTIAKIARDQDKQDDWESCVRSALLAIRTSPNESTKFTPAMLLYGYEMRTPATWPAPRTDYVEGEFEDEIASRAKVIKYLTTALWEQAKNDAEIRKNRDKNRYDQNVGLRRRFKIGEQVLMRDKTPSGKFSDRWIGPLVVTRVNNSGTYYLDGPNGGRLRGAVHGDNLMPYRQSKNMIPDVQVKRAEQHFQAWIEGSHQE